MELSLPLRFHRSRARRSHPLEILAARTHGRAAPRIALCVALALPPLAGGWLWLRGSSLVAVRHVHISGVHGPEALPIRQALDRAAEGMTTMHFDSAALRAALAAYPIVASVSAHTALPHSVSISVSERQPVAVLVGPGQRSAVAADGTVLGSALASATLPTLPVRSTPAPGRQLIEASALAAVTILGAAPGDLLRYVARVYEGSEGLTLQMRNGLLVYFGEASLPHAKWLSLARVLSSPEARGALYVDVRLPSRPAAGFTRDSSAKSAGAAAAAARIGSADPSAAALAERLSQDAGVGTANPSASSTGAEEEHSGSGGSAPASGGAQGESSAGSEASTAPRGEGEAGGAPAGGSSEPAQGSTSG